MSDFYYGNKDSDNVLIQMVDDHDLEVLENQVSSICKLFGPDFYLIALKTDNWNDDLSPWKYNNFAGNGEKTLTQVLEVASSFQGKNLVIGGYSLSALFALWASYKTDVFSAVAAASPSVWFPDFEEFTKTNKTHAKAVYLSLGDKEEKTRNRLMATVGTKIRTLYETYRADGVNCTLEWNPGNHFTEPDLRTAKAFAWTLNQTRLT